MAHLEEGWWWPPLTTDCNDEIIVQQGDEEIDLYYPIFMTVRFLFIFGWLRVAETLYNPFGEDDEDFELNELLNRDIS